MLYFQRRRATANSHHLDGILANHQDALRFRLVQRQQVLLILQQYDTFLCYLSGCIVVSLRTKEAIGLVAIHRGAIEQAQHATHLFVEFLGGELSFLDELLVGYCHVVTVVGIGTSHLQAIGPCAKLQVKTIGDSLFCVMAATPVTDYHTIEAPVALQNLIQEDIVMAVVLVFIEVIGTHDGPCPTLLYSSTEGWQVDFVEGTVTDDDIHLMAIFLVIVQRIVLHTRCHTLRLQALHIGHHHLRGQIRVFTHILEVTTSQWCAVDVHTRSQNDTLVAIERLFAQ